MDLNLRAEEVSTPFGNAKGALEQTALLGSARRHSIGTTLSHGSLQFGGEDGLYRGYDSNDSDRYQTLFQFEPISTSSLGESHIVPGELDLLETSGNNALDFDANNDSRHSFPTFHVGNGDDSNHPFTTLQASKQYRQHRPAAPTRSALCSTSALECSFQLPALHVQQDPGTLPSQCLTESTPVDPIAIVTPAAQTPSNRRKKTAAQLSQSATAESTAQLTVEQAQTTASPCKPALDAAVGVDDTKRRREIRRQKVEQQRFLRKQLSATHLNKRIDAIQSPTRCASEQMLRPGQGKAASGNQHPLAPAGQIANCHQSAYQASPSKAPMTVSLNPPRNKAVSKVRRNHKDKSLPKVSALSCRRPQATLAATPAGHITSPSSTCIPKQVFQSQLAQQICSPDREDSRRRAQDAIIAKAWLQLATVDIPPHCNIFKAAQSWRKCVAKQAADACKQKVQHHSNEDKPRVVSSQPHCKLLYSFPPTPAHIYQTDQCKPQTPEACLARNWLSLATEGPKQGGNAAHEHAIACCGSSRHLTELDFHGLLSNGDLSLSQRTLIVAPQDRTEQPLVLSCWGDELRREPLSRVAVGELASSLAAANHGQVIPSACTTAALDAYTSKGKRSHKRKLLVSDSAHVPHTHSDMLHA